MPPRHPGLIDIRTFADHDRDRGVVTRAARRAAAEIVLRMDLVTSPGGLDELTAPGSAMPPEQAEQYLQFRRWFSAFLTAELQAFFGRIIQASAVHADSGALVVYEDRVGRGLPPPDALRTFAGRLNWLVSEIPSLQDAYGQLMPEEAPRALGLCERVDALDLADAAQLEQAREAWTDLELFYVLAQPGARIMRGDEIAVRDAKVFLDRLAQEIEDEETQLRQVAEVAAGRRAPLTQGEVDEALLHVTAELAAADSKAEKLIEAQRANAAQRALLASQRDRLVAQRPAA